MTPGRSRLAQQRRAMGYTQEELAEALHVDRCTVHRWEAGRSEPQPYMRPKLATLLGVNRRGLETLIRAARSHGVVRTAPIEQPSRDERQQGPAPLADLRRAIIDRSRQAETPDATALRQAVNDAHQLYQHADYDATARFLPSLIARLDNQPAGCAAAARRAGGYLAAAKLATKLGDANLAWVAADRAYQAANESEHAALVGVARYQLACALFRHGLLADAQSVAAEAADDVAAITNVDDPRPNIHAQNISARGALLLLSAVLAASTGEAALARVLLRQAHALADALGTDDNYLWTGFGPTNVAIHELSVAVRLGETRKAHEQGAEIDTDRLPGSLVGRRSQVHLDLGRAATDVHDDGLAVLHLLEAERVATQSVSRNADAQETIATLLSREQCNTVPGLRALAQRAGFHV